ncbi:putative protease inhibitor 4 [Operophtera brumata]|uniref:Putative protease inhibitor 4 n=1 Tax=Operophtera brumata TaxID=104452 RepID=A0A0L7LLA8_OPEBR|nr:putative protease inhibitor 4 [Operophtera brumata]
MKLFVLCLLWFVALSMSKPHSRGCLYILGRCVEECPVGTHAYATGCSPVTPEATCDEPKPVMSKYAVCDYSSCHCDSPTVRDNVSNKCVKLEECPEKKELTL